MSSECSSSVCAAATAKDHANAQKKKCVQRCAVTPVVIPTTPAMLASITSTPAAASRCTAHAPPYACVPPRRRFETTTSSSPTAARATRSFTAGGSVAFRSTSSVAFTPENDAVKCTTVLSSTPLRERLRRSTALIHMARAGKASFQGGGEGGGGGAAGGGGNAGGSAGGGASVALPSCRSLLVGGAGGLVSFAGGGSGGGGDATGSTPCGLLEPAPSSSLKIFQGSCWSSATKVSTGSPARPSASTGKSTETSRLSASGTT